MTMLASQITSLTVVYSIVYSGVNQRKHQSSASLAFVWAIHRGPVNFLHKWPVTRKMFPFDDVIMECIIFSRRTNEKTFGLLESKAWVNCMIYSCYHRCLGMLIDFRHLDTDELSQWIILHINLALWPGLLQWFYESLAPPLSLLTNTKVYK